ncbi:dihydroxyacetone kinase phosphoryl donor subunit DhaM [Latilactobacillus sakei]|jgi:dihydroxyacetone kinase phosphotransfer subunit|uniref:dihydroxyacetone kinase phosphoryl donor subunit DhaM n=1 Tax=Latilactobacillus sakei TaxID=1599 RepID=UPI00029805F4|nr:dihydroxyacetone kinase phosphoryl donor subunit DhaM [Latilactobacillus sakei]EKQ06313.1 phosphoenolpyruvate-dihydroxyacetone phosphotransferase subunit [Lacticaseibacillus casei A2-362]UNC22154.1 PTS-dependent dihydroxyacetone kinase phosphotransferase subunit DhaM [Latilactobacillus sakei]UNC23981.1 PTS-dependent dihydroxyacetone kinase phosphotransferase subunit DhaM [Latilactobacillus sakei]
MSYGIIIASHVEDIARGVANLAQQAAKDVPITFAGGTDDGGIGSSMTKISAAIDANGADELLAFYDLGSAKMNLDMAVELADKPVHVYDVALVEGAYSAATLAGAGLDLAGIEAQLAPLKIK